jgi:hypothetical protein
LKKSLIEEQRVALDYGSALGFLRTVLRGVEERAIFFHEVTTEYLRSEGRVWALPSSNGTVVFTREARKAYESFTEALVADCPGLNRGIAFRRIRHELFRMMSKYVGTDPASLQAKQVAKLQKVLMEWFEHEAESREVFLPCAISPWPAPPFSIGPVRFTFINDVRQAEFYVSASALVREHDFGKMLERMQRDRGSWLAHVKVEGCDRARGEEIGALAIDLALVMLQLALPTSWNTRNISRLDARRGGADSQTFSRTANSESGSHSSHDAGMTIGEGTMQKILHDFSKLANAVGLCVTAFASGRFQLPNLQRSFCDAAYWFHEALAEKIDSIAIVKLETSLEVLLRSQSSKGSQARIRSVLGAFYGLASKDPVVPGSTQTADDFAKSIVGDRSQFLHGTLSTLQPLIGIDREGLEEFVQAVLRRAVIELADYSNLATASDRVEDFLGWVRDSSANAAPVTGP